MATPHFETIAIREQLERTQHNEHAAPVFLTSSFTFDSAEAGAARFSGTDSGNLYSRFSNPNTDELARKLALLEGAESGVTTASGMSAVYVCLAAHLSAGDHIVASKALFGNSLNILIEILPRFGITTTLVELTDPQGWEEAITPATKLIFIETPSNPTLQIADLQFLGNLSKAHDLLFVVDNCFATPYLQQPIRFGADIIIHSATKYIDGQGRVLGGAILGSESVVTPCYNFIRRTGPSLSPFNAWVLSKSLETLAVRMDRHCDNALQLATFLENHSAIEKVIYPHLPSHQGYSLAKQQMHAGGGLVGCEIKGGVSAGSRFLNALELHSLTANLGDTRSIATHPASTTHSKLAEEERIASGITPGFLRFSVGLEHIEDIIRDVEIGLNASKS